MGMLIKCLLFLDVSVCRSEHNVGDSVSICRAGAASQCQRRQNSWHTASNFVVVPRARKNISLYSFEVG